MPRGDSIRDQRPSANRSLILSHGKGILCHWSDRDHVDLIRVAPAEPQAATVKCEPASAKKSDGGAV